MAADSQRPPTDVWAISVVYAMFIRCWRLLITRHLLLRREPLQDNEIWDNGPCLSVECLSSATNQVSELELFETRELVCLMSIILYLTVILLCRMLKEHFSCANERTNISGTCIDPPKETFHTGGACMCNTPKHKDPPMHACNAENTKDMLPAAGTHTEFQTTFIFLQVTQISLVVSNENKKADVLFTLSACSSPLRTEKIQTHHQTLGNTSLTADQRIQHRRSTDVLKHHVNNYSHSNM